MGEVMLKELGDEPGLEVVGGLAREDADRSEELLAGADVLVEFTHPPSSGELMLAAIRAGVRPVSGTSGVPESTLAEVDAAAREAGLAALWAPNFRLGAVLMSHFAQMAARYFDTAEIVEAHHTTKADSPSGTAGALAAAIRESHGADLIDAPPQHESIVGTRGGALGGVRIHSLRLPGIIGWHDVRFATAHEILTIRHEDLSRDGYP